MWKEFQEIQKKWHKEMAEIDKPKTVEVPIEELEKLEEARVALYDLVFPHLPTFADQVQFQVLTTQMWRVANTKKWGKGEKV